MLSRRVAGLVSCLLIFAVAGVAACGQSCGAVTATGSGQAVAWFTARGVEAEVEGALEFSLLGTTFRGFGHGTGILELATFAGWGWAVVWAHGEDPGDELVGGLAVEGSPALGSGSVTGTCAFVVRQGDRVSEYRGTFVTKASSHLAPVGRPGALTLDGEIAITFAFAPSDPGVLRPWDPSRWPADLLSEFVERSRL